MRAKLGGWRCAARMLIGMSIGVAVLAPSFASDHPVAAPAASAPGLVRGDVLDKKLGKLIPGKSTKAQVLALLGPPWRTVQYNDMDELEDEIWEYRAVDAKTPFRAHIEFDHRDIVRIVGRIAEASGAHGGSPARSRIDPAAH